MHGRAVGLCPRNIDGAGGGAPRPSGYVELMRTRWTFQRQDGESVSISVKASGSVTMVPSGGIQGDHTMFRLKPLLTALLATMLLATLSDMSWATEQAQQRRAGRQVNQETRQGARHTKQECRAANQKSNAACRQEKRHTKAQGRQEKRHVKYGTGQ